MTGTRSQGRSLRFAMAQINPTVGDLEGNLAICEAMLADAIGQAADVIVFPELALTGYPPEDLLLAPGFRRDARLALERFAAKVAGPVVLVGTPLASDSTLYNAMAVIADGEVKGTYRKVHLPNYGVFDERRYFSPGDGGMVISVNGIRVGLSICEDIWVDGPPTSDCADAGAEVLVNISASPFHAGKTEERTEVLRRRAAELGMPIAWCALVGGQDELVFDGGSMVMSSAGDLLAEAPLFEEDLLLWDFTPDGTAPQSPRPAPPHDHLDLRSAVGSSQPPALQRAVRAADWSSGGEIARIAGALELGLRDYVIKNGFTGVVFGVSGGIDSAVVAALARSALGAQAVHGVIMPSPWSSPETQADARTLLDGLGVEPIELPIEHLMAAFATTLAPAGHGAGHSLAEENIQARIRGNLLMALSNEHGWLVLTTGNKSELAVGYSTLYGDAAGGFAPLKDTPKTVVFELAHHFDRSQETPIPRSIVDRPPSAELRPGQLDTDSLPPYEDLDRMIRMYVEEQMGAGEIIEAGFDEAVVRHVLGLIDRAEYKRRQYPPGVKITPVAFGRDRRMPITNRYVR